jgi:hypothetical protein
VLGGANRAAAAAELLLATAASPTELLLLLAMPASVAAAVGLLLLATATGLLLLATSTSLAVAIVPRDRVLAPIIRANAGHARLPIAGLTAMWGLGTVAITMCDEGGGAVGLLLRVDVDLGELHPREAVRERGQGRISFEDLGLEPIRLTQPVKELMREIAVVDGPPESRQVVRNGLEFAGIGSDGHVTARSAAEGLAEEEVPGVLVGEEEALQPTPRGEGEAVGPLDEAMKII